MKDIFVMSSIREREMLLHFKNLQGDFEIEKMSVVNGYSKWDAVINSGGTRMLLEIKVRDWNSWEQDGWFLEEDKFVALDTIQDSQYEKNGIYMKKYYVNIFKDGVAMFDLDEITPDFTPRMSKKSVMAQDGERKTKMMATLPIESSTFYEHKFCFPHFNYLSEHMYKKHHPGRDNYSSFFVNSNSNNQKK